MTGKKKRGGGGDPVLYLHSSKYGKNNTDGSSLLEKVLSKSCMRQ